MIKLKNLIETPDKLDIPPRQSWINIVGNQAFVYVIPSKKIFFSEPGMYHSEDNFDDDFHYELKKRAIDSYFRGENDNILVEGRIFSYNKIITLWQYPPSDIFFDMINAMEKYRNESMMNWTIEVFKYVESNIIEKGSYEKKLRLDKDLLKAHSISVRDYR